MSFLPDTGELVALANRLADHADAVRSGAERLRSAVAAAGWHGRAATAFESAAVEVIESMRRSGGRLDGAADALRDHARRVQDVVDAASRVEHLLVHLGTDVVSALRQGLVTPQNLLDGALPGVTGAAGAAASQVGHALHRVGSALGLG